MFAHTLSNWQCIQRRFSTYPEGAVSVHSMIQALTTSANVATVRPQHSKRSTENGAERPLIHN